MLNEDVLEIDDRAQTLRNLCDQAIRRLAQREYGEEELRRKLLPYTNDPADVEAVLEQMKQAGQLSDDRFIEVYIQSRVRRGFGPIRIVLELREKGISSDDLEGPLAIWQSSWTSVAKRVLEKKYTGKKNNKNQELDKKALLFAQKRFLTYRGFDMSTIQQVFGD